jgi:hypothetical protein
MNARIITPEPESAERDTWATPTLTVHGDFTQLTQFSSGPGPDDGFYDPGAAASQA